MSKIYISSTYSDLQAYRERVYRALRQMNHDVIAMEDYVATDERPVNKCLNDVASCELYIGIFAWRYGFIPKDNNPELKSITELEFRQAKKEDIDCLLFLQDDKAGWPPSQMDTGRKLSRIKTLREEFTNNHTVSFFKDPENLAALVSAAVNQWEKQKIAERESEAIKFIMLTEVSRGVGRLEDIIDFVFLLPHLGTPNEKPQNIPEDLKAPARYNIDVLSDEWINSLRTVNFIPRRGWASGYRPLGSLDVYIKRHDPYNTTVPYCLDSRQFHEIVSEETKKAKEEIETGLQKIAPMAFSSMIVGVISKLLQHNFLNYMVGLADYLERWIRIEDTENANFMKMPFIKYDSAIADYKDFMQLLTKLAKMVRK